MLSKIFAVEKDGNWKTLFCMVRHKNCRPKGKIFLCECQLSNSVNTYFLKYYILYFCIFNLHFSLDFSPQSSVHQIMSQDLKISLLDAHLLVNVCISRKWGFSALFCVDIRLEGDHQTTREENWHQNHSSRKRSPNQSLLFIMNI